MQSPSLRVRRGSSSFNPRKTIVMAGQSAKRGFAGCPGHPRLLCGRDVDTRHSPGM